MSNIRRAAAVGLAAAIVAATAACGGSEEESPASGPAAVRVAVAQGLMTNVVDYIAADQGFFTNRGVDVELLPVANGPAALAAAIAGDADLFFNAPGNAVTAASKGTCVKVIGSGQRQTVNIIARNDVPTPNADKPFPQNLVDLKGLTIGISSKGGTIDTIARYLMKQAGLNPDSDASLIAQPAGAAAATVFESKQVDVLFSYPPIEQTIGVGNYKYIANLVADKNSPIALMLAAPQVTTCEFAEKSPDALLSYCKAIWDAYDFANQPANADKVAASLSKHLPAEKALADTLWKDYAVLSTSNEISQESWDFTKQFFAAGTPDAPYDQFVYQPCAGSDPR